MKNEKGYTSIDIAISVIIITMFISLIAVLVYRFNSTSNKLELQSEATSIAIDEIENIKAKGFEAYQHMNKKTKEDENGQSLINQPTGREGFYKTISVQDYTDIEGNEEKTKDIVKKITVKISYIFQAKEQVVELSTILLKENES